MKRERKIIKRSIVAAVGIAAVFTVSLFLICSTPAFSSGHIMLGSDEIKWDDAASLPGAKISVLEGDPAKTGPVTMRLKLPPNYKLMPHTHPVDERVTVLSGALYMGLGDKLDEKAARKYSAGGFFVIAADTPMYAFTKDEETVIQINVTSGPWGLTYTGEHMMEKK